MYRITQTDNQNNQDIICTEIKNIVIAKLILNTLIETTGNYSHYAYQIEEYDEITECECTTCKDGYTV